MGFIFRGHIFKGGLICRGHINRIYSIGYGIEFNHFIKIFGNFKGKKTWKDPPEERDENTGT